MTVSLLSGARLRKHVLTDTSAAEKTFELQAGSPWVHGFTHTQRPIPGPLKKLLQVTALLLRELEEDTRPYIRSKGHLLHTQGVVTFWEWRIRLHLSRKVPRRRG